VSGGAAFPCAATVGVCDPKASNPEHAEENARAEALDLSDAEFTKIDAAFPLDPCPRPLPML
jgi:diketogulonate reductase-like aldo/keto reductase